MKNLVLNMAGRRLTDEQLEDISMPRTEMLIHITYKTLQTGAVLGLGVVGPLVSVYKGNRDFESIKTSALDYGRKGAKLGLAAGPLVTLGRLVYPRMDHSQACDMAYRIRCNRNQVNVDRLTTVGAVIGAGAMYATGGDSINGAIVGLGAGCILGGIINLVFAK